MKTLTLPLWTSGDAPLGFKARVGNLIRTWWSPTCYTASMISKPIYSKYLWAGFGAAWNRDLLVHWLSYSGLANFYFHHWASTVIWEVILISHFVEGEGAIEAVEGTNSHQVKLIYAPKNRQVNFASYPFYLRSPIIHNSHSQKEIRVSEVWKK